MAGTSKGLKKAFHATLILSVMAAGIVLGLSKDIHLFHPLDKLAHMIGFGVFTYLFGSYTRSYFWAMVFAIFAGISVEVLQMFIPSRTFSLMDVGADAAGAGMVWSLYLFKSAFKTHRPIRVGDLHWATARP